MSSKNGELLCGDDEDCGNLRPSEHFEEDTQNKSLKWSNTTLSPDEPTVLANWDNPKSSLDWDELEGKSCITSYEEFDNTLEAVEYLSKYSAKTNKNDQAANCKDAENKKFDTEMGNQNSLQTIAANKQEDIQNTIQKLNPPEPDITWQHNYITLPENISKAVSNTTLSPDEPTVLANWDNPKSSLDWDELEGKSCITSYEEFDNTLEAVEYLSKYSAKTNKNDQAANCKDAENKKFDTEMGNQNSLQTIAANKQEDIQNTIQKLNPPEPDITWQHNYITLPENISKAVSNTTLSPDEPTVLANWDNPKSSLDWDELEGKSCITSYEEFDNTLEAVEYLSKYSAKTNKNDQAANCKDAENKKFDTEMGNQNSLQTIAANKQEDIQNTIQKLNPPEPDITWQHNYITLPENISKAVSNTTLSPDEPTVLANWDNPKSSLDWDELEGKSCITSYEEFDNTLEAVEYLSKYSAKTNKNDQAANCKDAENKKFDTEMGNQNSLQTIAANKQEDIQNTIQKLNPPEPDITWQHNYITLPENISKAVSNTTLSPDEPTVLANWDNPKSSLDWDELEGKSCITSYEEFDNTLEAVEYLSKYSAKTNKNDQAANCKDAENKKFDTEMGNQNSLQTIAANKQEDIQNTIQKLNPPEPDITWQHNYITLPENISKAVSNTTLSPDEPTVLANWDNPKSSLDWDELEGKSCITSYEEFDNTLEAVEYLSKYSAKTNKNDQAANCKDAENKKFDTEMGNQNSLQTIAANKQEDIQNTIQKLNPPEPDITWQHNYITLPENISKAVSNTTLSPDEPTVLANWDNPKSLLDWDELEGKSCVTSYEEFDNTLEAVEYLSKYSAKTNKNDQAANCKDAENKKFDTEMGNQNSLQTIAANKQEDIQNTIQKLKKAVSNTTLSPDEPNLFANGGVSETFLNLEKMVEACDNSFPEFDNTLEEIEILKNAPLDSETKQLDTESVKMSAHGNRGKLALNLKPSALVTPKKEEQKEKIFATSSSVLQSKPSLYKTPANTLVFQKTSKSSLKKSPSKNPAFLHVASPVAYYINNSPRIPLMRNVHPKETVPRPPSVPELVKTTGFNPSNKEYVNLPNVAYKSAKETRVIDVSNAPKMPQSQWAKKLTQSNPRPAVIKHTHREECINKSSGTTNRDPEDSFGDLSLHQAEISICTKKAA